MTATPAAPFAPGDRVRRTRLDHATGTVETVTPYQSDTGQWAIAVRLDQDGEVWSGTETAWETEPAATPEPVTEPGPTFTRVTAAYTDQRPGDRGRDEFEVAVTRDGTILLDLYAHGPDKTRVEVPADHALAVNLRGLLYAAQAGAIA